ncbi:hypothetical protein GGI23_006621, partial [Coemansia sp. RSA 2559]
GAQGRQGQKHQPRWAGRQVRSGPHGQARDQQDPDAQGQGPQEAPGCWSLQKTKDGRRWLGV